MRRKSCHSASAARRRHPRPVAARTAKKPRPAAGCLRLVGRGRRVQQKTIEQLIAAASVSASVTILITASSVPLSSVLTLGLLRAERAKQSGGDGYYDLYYHAPVRNIYFAHLCFCFFCVLIIRPASTRVRGWPAGCFCMVQSAMRLWLRPPPRCLRLPCPRHRWWPPAPWPRL